MKFIITDWMNNVCFESDNQDFQSFDDACEYLDRMVEEDLISEGINPFQATEDEYNDCREQYSIEEYREGIDRLMWNGQRYVLKQDYCRVIA